MLNKFIRVCIAVLFTLFASYASIAKTLHPSIPVVDMRDFYAKNRKQKFITQLREALKTVGFVAVIHSPIDQDILDNAYNSTKNFFSKQLEYKLQFENKSLSGQRGYVQSEIAQGQVRKDYKEFFHVAKDFADEVAEKYNYPKNIWPDDVKFKQAMTKFMSEIEQYSEAIAQAIALSIDKPENFFTDMIEDGASLIRAIHYPANPPVDTVWAAEHTDIDLFTILPRATTSGLQILNAKGEWVDVIVPKNAFIINAGDMLQNITNGYYKSSKHRVISQHKNKDRYSIVAFIHPKLTVDLSPLEQFKDLNDQQLYQNATSGELLRQRLVELGLLEK